MRIQVHDGNSECKGVKHYECQEPKFCEPKRIKPDTSWKRNESYHRKCDLNIIINVNNGEIMEDYRRKEEDNNCCVKIIINCDDESKCKHHKCDDEWEKHYKDFDECCFSENDDERKNEFITY